MKNKTMKKLLAGMLSAVLVLGCLAGCGKSGEESADTPNADASEEAEEPKEAPASKADGFKIAVGLPDSGATMFSLMSNNIIAMAEAMGGTVVFQGGVGASADATIQFVEDQIAAGVNGLTISPPSDSVLTTVTTLCEEAEVYWGITFRSIQDDEVREFVESSPYYVGRCYEDEEDTGYRVMANMNKSGVKNVAIISMAKGNNTTDLREQGAQRACEEFGMQIVAEARDLTQASDATNAAESFLTAYGDLDAIFVVGTTGAGMHEAVAKAISDAGKSDTVKLATIDFPDSMGELFEQGALITCSGAPSWGFDPFIISSVLMNTCKGTPISDKPVNIAIPMFDINEVDTANKWLEKYGDASNLYFETDYISQTLDKANNGDLTEESLTGIVEQFVKDTVN
jgi:ABC-type sugar transport system substrate-binding protein